MDYEKAYKEALERARSGMKIDEVFPELHESEDERIRKDLICEVQSWDGIPQSKREKYVAYLEKQNTEFIEYGRQEYFRGRAEAIDEQKTAECSDAERKQLYSDGYYSSRNNLALDFMHYLDEHRPEGKMCLSQWECEALMKAFKVGDVETIVRYINKYQQPAQVADASKMELPESGGSEKPNYQQPEVDLEKAIDAYIEPIEPWQIREAPFTSMENTARHFYELGLNARKEE